MLLVPQRSHSCFFAFLVVNSSPSCCRCSVSIYGVFRGNVLKMYWCEVGYCTQVAEAQRNLTVLPSSSDLTAFHLVQLSKNLFAAGAMFIESR